MKYLIPVTLGAFFGAVLIASQAFHWFRIQEMFHFDSFHMYGLLGSAIGTAALGIWLLRVFKIRSVNGATIQTKQKPLQPIRNSAGGLLFGLGWGITGACTAPLFILVGWQWQVGATVLIGALLGTILYAAVEQKLPK